MKKTTSKKRAPKAKADPFAITKAGLYANIPADRYHADPLPEPSGSASFYKAIHESSLAHARLIHPRLNPDYVAKPATSGMDFGSAYHTLLLDSGKVVVVEAGNWQTDAAKDKRRQVRALGATPILAADWTRARAMAAKLREELARKDSPLPDVFDPKYGGQSEVTAAWREDGVWSRARADRWIPPGKMPGAPSGMIVDIKTTADLATPEVWSTKLYNLGSDFQAVLYPHGFVMASHQSAQVGRGDKLPRFVFIVQEDKPPYAHSILELDEIAQEHARGKIIRAFSQFCDAMKSGDWPAYPRAIAQVSPPVWEMTKEERAMMAAGVMQKPLAVG